MSVLLHSLTSQSRPGRYLVVTESGSRYLFALSLAGITMVRVPGPGGGVGDLESACLYRDAEPLPVASIALVVGARGRIVFGKPDRFGTRNRGGFEYSHTTRDTTPVVSIRRIGNEGDL